MPNSRTLHIYNTDGHDAGWSIEVAEPDDDYDMEIILWKRPLVRASFYIAPERARELAIMLLRAAG